MEDKSRRGQWDSDVFIAHASEDKDEVARPLAEILTSAGWDVWLDELKLTIGDSLSRRIDSALARTRFGVVVLSPAFFAKEWPQRELAGLAAREVDMGSKVILPVWHNVDHRFIVEHSPVLADRLGAVTGAGLEKVAEEISLALEDSGVDQAKRGPQGPTVRAVESEDESDGPSLLQIPTTTGEQTRLIHERPDSWEYLLYAGVLVQGRIDLEDKWQDHGLRLPGGSRREPDPGSVPDFLSSEIGWVVRQFAALERIFDPDVFEKAFGGRGEPGDAVLISRIARGIIKIYESLLDWAAALRNATVPTEFDEILELSARIVDAPIHQIREFIQTASDQIARIPILEEEAKAKGATKEAPMILTLTLALSLDQDLQKEFQTAFTRVG
jgi:TIR domain